MSEPTRLSDVIEEFIASRQGGRRQGTMSGDRTTLNHLLVACGNIQVKSLDARHGDLFLARIGKTCQASTIQLHFTRLKVFVKWMKARKYLGPWDDPFATVSLPRADPKAKLRIPASQFGRVLDCATHPRDRIIVALGLYLFLRASEMRSLRLASVDLEAREILVVITKTKTAPDPMPISKELDRELRRWLTWYHASAPFPLEKEHALIPAKTAPQRTGTKGLQGFHGMKNAPALNPASPVRRPASRVQAVLTASGYPVRDSAGRSLYEGVHTLRRSGARALFDKLLSDSYDGSLRTCQAMLHHASAAMTERYLGIDLDIKKRNELLRGESMFGEEAADATILELAARG